MTTTLPRSSPSRVRELVADSASSSATTSTSATPSTTVRPASSASGSASTAGGVLDPALTADSASPSTSPARCVDGASQRVSVRRQPVLVTELVRVASHGPAIPPAQLQAKTALQLAAGLRRDRLHQPGQPPGLQGRPDPVPRHVRPRRHRQVPAGSGGGRGHRDQDRGRRARHQTASAAGWSTCSSRARGPASSPPSRKVMATKHRRPDQRSSRSPSTGSSVSAPDVNERDRRRQRADLRRLHQEGSQGPRGRAEVRRAAAVVRDRRGRRRSRRPWAATSCTPACSPGRSGLFLVVLYSLLYYRGLGLVSVALPGRGRRR